MGGLETLPEASSEEESLPTVKDDAESSSPSTFSFSSLSRQRSQSVACLDFSMELEGIRHCGVGITGPSSKTQRRRHFQDFTNEEFKEDPHKIFLLESIIQQLRDELRECRDQNELLEFRLLEIEEAPQSNNIQVRVGLVSLLSYFVSFYETNDGFVCYITLKMEKF